MSLRTKLVLLLSGLTVLVVGVAVGVAYEEVRRAAWVTADQRLGRVVEQLADLAARSTEERLRVKEAAGSEPVLRSLLRGQMVDTAEVLEVLALLRTPADSNLVVQVWDRDGTPVFTDLPGPAGLPSADAPLDTVPSYGAFRTVGEEVRYWSTSPVVARDGTILGWVVQERRIGNPQSAAQIEELIGPDTRVVFTVAGDSLGVTLAGEEVAAPGSGPATDTLLVYERAGRTFLARADTVPASPWSVLVETPLSTVESPLGDFLDRMIILAGLLVLATVGIGALFGRRLTRPLRELVGASEALARGDPAGEVPGADGGDEISRLAAAFNEMARRVSETHQELERRLESQSSLARALEESTIRAERARREAQEANRAKSDFLATMSHEVRTPINAIIGYCDLLDLQVSGPLTDQQRDKIERIRLSSRVLTALVEDVLDFAGLDSGRLRVQRDVAPLVEAVRGATAVVEPQAAKAGLGLEIDVPAGLAFVGDAPRVEQILANLLSNAVKFTEEGGVILRARRVAAGDGDGSGPRPQAEAPEHGWIRVDVEDTGVGIPEEDRERVFEPFVQAETGFTRRFAGTGLGLSISLELARMMDGDLTLESEVGKGSRFSLWLPAADGAHPTDS